MNKFCENCGKELKENADVCLNCGIIIKKAEKTDNTSKEQLNKNASIGLILGLISIVAWIIPLFGYPVTICGLLYSIKGLSSKLGKNKAIAGMILAIIFMIFTLINSVVGVIIGLGSI